MKCPDCDTVLVLTPLSMIPITMIFNRDEDFCPKCNKRFTGQEFQNIKDADMIENDMNYYKETVKYK